MLTINTRTADHTWFVGHELPNVSSNDIVTLVADENELDFLKNNVKADCIVHQNFYGSRYLIALNRKAKDIFQSLINHEEL